MFNSEIFTSLAMAIIGFIMLFYTKPILRIAVRQRWRWEVKDGDKTEEKIEPSENYLNIIRVIGVAFLIIGSIMVLQILLGRV